MRYVVGPVKVVLDIADDDGGFASILVPNHDDFELLHGSPGAGEAYLVLLLHYTMISEI